MNKFNSKNKNIIYKHDRTVRIISHFKDGNKSVGTGFLINGGKNILTCWHVVCGVDLKILKNSLEFKQSIKTAESEKIDEYFGQKILKLEIELPNGSKLEVILESYDYYHDLAVLKIPANSGKFPFFELELKNTLDYSNEINFTGYPECLGYNLLNSPFAFNIGTVSSFPKVEISGGKYPMTKLTSICIGGNSGSPLFRKGNNKPCGIINGYQWSGRDDLAIYQKDGLLEKGSLRVIINISYATSFYQLMKGSKKFRQLIKSQS